MTLPTANMTLHVDASTNADVWQHYQSGSPYHNTTPADGAAVEVWADPDRTSGFGTADTSLSPRRATTSSPMLFPALSFNGSSHFMPYRTQELADSTLGNLKANTLFAATGKTLLVAFYATDCTRNNANAYDNHGILSTAAGDVGMYLRKSATNVFWLVGLHAWQGNPAAPEVPLTLNTPHIGCYRHDGTNVYISIDGGTEASIASAESGTLLNNVLIGTSTSGSGFFPGYIGELVTYNEALVGTDLTDAINFLRAKWDPAYVPPPPPPPPLPPAIKHHYSPDGGRAARGRGAKFRAHGPYHWPPIPEHKRH